MKKRPKQSLRYYQLRINYYKQHTYFSNRALVTKGVEWEVLR